MSSRSLGLRQRAQSTASLRRRMVRMNSEQRNGQMKKSATMTSFRPKLERLIQEGKIETLMNQDPSSKAHLHYTNHVNEMDKELSSTKKSLSSLVTKSRAKEASINSVKNSIQKLEREIQIIQREAHTASKKYSGSGDQLELKREAYERIFWVEKTFGQLKARGYKDEVFLRGRCEGLQRVYEAECESQKLLQTKYHEVRQLNRELQGFRGQAERIAGEQVRDKNEFIALMEADMSERELLGELKADKFRREGEINQIAASLIEREQLLRILEVLYAHRVLSQIIKVKSNSLISRYERVSSAYNYIKSNSNIVEPDKILKRMEEHDKLYDDALKRVNALEAQLLTSENSLENCLISKNQILSREGQDHCLPKHYYQGLEADKYELLQSEKDKLQHRNREDEVLRLNTLEWARRIFGRLGIIESESSSWEECLEELVVRLQGSG